jgi:hypothetical protein
MLTSLKNIPNLKIVIRFKSNRPISQIRNLLERTIWGKIETKLKLISDSTLQQGYTIEKDLNVTKIGDIYEVYPSIGFHGVSELDNNIIKERMSGLLVDLKSILKDNFASINVTDAEFKIRFPDERTKQVDEI